MKPAFVKTGPVTVDGREATRLMIVLKTRGCEYAKRTGGCTMCGFANHADPSMGPEQMLEQLDHVLATVPLDGVEEIDLLTLGSFFDDREINGAFRRQAMSRLARLPAVRRVSAESRAEHITVDKLVEMKELLPGKTFELGIGIESTDEHIRNEVIKKGLSARALDDAMAKLAEAGVAFLAYLLIKPPGLSEAAAIEDAVHSAEYVFALAASHGVRARVAFEPVFVCAGTPLEELFSNGEYQLVSLWSVVDVILRTHHLGELFVGLSDETLSFGRMGAACDSCTPRIIDAIDQFIGTGSVAALDALDCPCRAEYRAQLERS